MERSTLVTCLCVAVVATMFLVVVSSTPVQESHDREIRAAERSRSGVNGTASHKGGKGSGGTSKPSSSSNRGGKGQQSSSPTRKSFGNQQRPRAPITGKPVESQHKNKPKTLSPLLAPRNPKHRTTTTTTEEPEFDDEEEEFED